MLGASLVGQKKYGDGEPLLTSGYEGIVLRQSSIPVADRSVLEETAEWVVKLYQEWGKPQKAGEWRRRILRSKSSLSQSRPDHPSEEH